MTTVADLYSCVRTGTEPNDFRLVPLRPIQTCDAASTRVHGPAMPLLRDGQSVRLATARESGRGTRDDVLTGPEPVTRIALGKVWVGDDGDPLVAQANYATAALGAGCFAASQPLRAEALDDVISLGKVWLGTLETVRAKLTADAPVVTADTSGGRKSLFSSQPTADYAAALKAGRQAQARAPTPTADRTRGAPSAHTQQALFGTARTAAYAANLAAKRRAKE